ncbi:MAG TPA: choice-of-anchor D domain-containing protein, partial [Nitrospirota bacterium]|nr:choice-of-anchor D domain-containing protein [Nitrospirota bacterium]
APIVSGFNSSWVAVAAGLSHSLALQANGTLWAWGSNTSGELGGGVAGPPSNYVPSQVQNPGTSPYVSISAGDSFSFARQANGTLWSWGKNTSGQLGNGTSDPDQINPLPHPAPVQVNGNAGAWISVKNGGSHTVALKADGTLDAWGNNSNGQLGDGTVIAKNAPSSLVEGHLVMAPVTVDFGTIATGKTASRTIGISNNSSAPVTVSSLQLAGADKTMFSVTAASCGSLPFTIAAGGNCPIQATFNPAMNAGGRSATLTATSNDPLNPAVTINFSAMAQTTFTVIASTAGGLPVASGTISPSGSIKALPGDRPVFTITPGTGYHITDVTVDGASKGAVTSVTLPPVAANAFITASFAINTYAISLAPDVNGRIIGPGAANYGSTPTYTVTPNFGYHVTDVKVNGVSKGAVTAVTLPPVTANATIAATFGLNTYTITAEHDARGAMTPSGPARVNHGSSQTYTFTPSPGYYVVNVIVDGVSQGAPASYTFDTVTSEGHSIRVVFTPDGDVDNNGKVDIADALRALRIAVGLVALAEPDKRHGDVAPLNTDGIPVPDRQITAVDALVILKKVVGLTSGW